ncbi:tail fiber assembly protein [Xenorhabdus stockiae]|uniref:tail fiber assembly protein n=1 Tax=Xenorhabdus stockiae TaxID=351614 RepID=UPI003CECC5D2
MKYYKSEDNQVYAYESEGFQESWVEPGLMPITEAEARAIANPPPPPPTPEELKQTAEVQKSFLRQRADSAIAPLQDAVDLDMATKEEKSALLKWKKYRVLLNRVDCSTAPDIVWPEQPE